MKKKYFITNLIKMLLLIDLQKVVTSIFTYIFFPIMRQKILFYY